MVTWADKVAWVGFTVKPITPESTSYFKYAIKLSYNPGRCSYGDGDMMEKAIEDAALGIGIDWWSVEKRITEYEWQRMAHM